MYIIQEVEVEDLCPPRPEKQSSVTSETCQEEYEHSKHVERELEKVNNKKTDAKSKVIFLAFSFDIENFVESFSKNFRMHISFFLSRELLHVINFQTFTMTVEAF